MGRPYVSCLIPARNESGRIALTVSDALATELIDEIIIIEGGSTDDTWKAVQELAQQYRIVTAAQQDGRGKFDAVRKGFLLSKGDLIVIWDADGTVNSTDFSKLIESAIRENRTTIGDRLKGNRFKGSMRFANLLGNYAFALLWKLVLGFKTMDLLCGSKVFTRTDFQNIPNWVLNQDPFGDFSLIASAVVNRRLPNSIPVNYYPRSYGNSNIRRWRSGLKLLVTTLYCFAWILISKLSMRSIK